MKTPLKRELWFLQIDGTEFGPFTQPELEALIAGRKLKGTFYVWHEGMRNWEPASATAKLAHLAEYLGGRTHVHRERVAPAKKSFDGFQSRDLRVAARRALIATVSVETGPRTRFMIGICEDISLTGMQVILDAAHELRAGSPLTLRVDPLGLTKIQAFTVTGKVAWLKERRLGVAFGTLNPQHKRSLEHYLKSARERTQTSGREIEIGS